MNDVDVTELLGKIEIILGYEGNLIEINTGKVIFVGDTHGDFDATERVIERYLSDERAIVFLGDYVDRGPASEENLNYLLNCKTEYPDNLFLLMGNHEGQRALPFHPADFWERLSPELYERYAEVLSMLPLVAVTANGIVALHGALPDVKSLNDIRSIRFGDARWHQITWGDWREGEEGYFGSSFLSGRPQFGRHWFDDIMGRLNKSVLVRSHQPDVDQVIYGGKCLTLFTSSAYRSVVPERTIAIADLSKKVETVDDLILETV
ncbi:MAG: metallophosphoesterase [Dehalococcoidia bacterium]